MPPVIRLARPEDAPQILAIYAPSIHGAATSFELTVPTVEEMRRRITKTLDHLPWLVCVDGEEVMGYVYASPHRVREAYQWSLEATVYVHEAHRRKGVGAALYTSLFAILRLQGYVNVYGGITQPNPGSVHLHKSLGFGYLCTFHHVGHKLGKWHDVSWWHLTLQEPPEDPSPPLVVGDAIDSTGWQAGLESGLPLLAV